MVIVGGLIPAGLLVPNLGIPLNVLPLPCTWQVPAMLLCALICGPRAGVIAAIAYLTIGLFQLPVFHGGGGSPRYLLTPGFGYLAGFVPAAWVSGKLAIQNNMNDFIPLTFSAAAGLLILHFCGVLNLFIGSFLGRWPNNLTEMLFAFTLGPIMPQLALCAGVGLIALPLRRLLLIE